MPFEDIDQRGPSASSHFFEGICFPSERQVGFQTPKATPENQVGMEGIKSMFADDASFPLEKLVPIEMQLGNCLELQHFTEKLCIGGAKGSYGFCKSSLMYRDQHPKLRSNLYMQQSSCCADGLQKTIIGGTESESSLFSSSFSDIYSRKLKLSGYDVPFHQSDNSVASHIKKESSQSCEEIEAQAIGSMLPDEDDLFSGMLDHLGPNLPACGSDEDFDLFSSGGGMELEGDNKSRVVQRTDTTGQILKGRALSERSIGERPSRTLFVRNINGNVEDSELKTLFEQYGNIQTLYTACKHHGFIVICFHEIRAAQNALKSLQNKTLKQKKLDIHYLIPKKNPSDEANWGPIMAFNFDPSAVQQFGLFESSEFQEGKKYADQVHHGFHSHSFPEHLDNLSNSTTPWESLNSIRNMSSNVGLMRREGTESRYIHGVSPNGQLMEQCRRVVGSNSYNQHTANNSSIWGKSLPYVNGFQEHTLPKSPGFPQPLPHLSDTTSALHHHMGSAPTVYPSPNWDRRYAYSGESPQASSYEMGSLGSIFSHVGGNSMDINTNVGQQFHQQMGHAFPERKSVIQMPVNFEAPNGRLRSLSHRRSDTNFNNVDKKQYELDIDRILRGDDSRTTLMIKNIPNKYTSKMLLAAIDENCRGSYDFIYLPIDFKNKCNVGYAFINMIDPRGIIPFHQAFNGKKWEKFNSEKVASLAYARIQGKAALIVHFQNSSLMNEDKRCRPILFQTTGPNAGDQEPFPMGCSKYDREKTNSIPVVMRRITT